MGEKAAGPRGSDRLRADQAAVPADGVRCLRPLSHDPRLHLLPTTTASSRALTWVLPLPVCARWNMTLRQLMTEPTGYTPKTKDQAKALFRKWSLFRKSDDHDADQAGSRDKFQEAVGIVTTDAAGIAAIGLGLAQVVGSRVVQGG